MAFVIYDEMTAADALTDFERRWPGRNYEVVNGDVIVAPMPNDEHQDFVSAMNSALYDVVQASGRGGVRPGVNLTDRHAGWAHNYINPDVVVFLRTNPAVNHGTHWQGGPDLAVEVISPGEPPHAKLAFYGGISTRELLVVRRGPWGMELWNNPNGARMELAATVGEPGAPELVSAVGVAFGLEPGEPRPVLTVRDLAGGRVWRS